jgi:hypothetical protein
VEERALKFVAEACGAEIKSGAGEVRVKNVARFASGEGRAICSLPSRAKNSTAMISSMKSPPKAWRRWWWRRPK